MYGLFMNDNDSRKVVSFTVSSSLSLLCFDHTRCCVRAAATALNLPIATYNRPAIQKSRNNETAT